MKDISIVIVNYNVRYFLSRCLESIYSSDLQDLDVDVYVVDNASVDGSVDMIRQDFPEVHLIASKDNLGFAKGNNLALRLIDSKYVLLLNPDTIIQEDTLSVCFQKMETDATVGALGVKMIDGTGRFLPESKRALPDLWNSTSKLLGLSSIFPKSKLFNGYALGHLDEDQNHDIEVLCGAFMFMRKEVLDKVGLLDEAFFMYGEDIDLSYRILKGGYKIKYLADSQIIHYKGESTKKSSLNYVKTFYGAMSIYVNKHYQGNTGKVLSRLINAAIVFRAMLSMVKRFVVQLFPVFLDALLLWVVLYLFGQFWANYRFDNPDYYDNRYFFLSISLYALMIPMALAFLGYYKKTTWRKRIEGVIGGGLIMLGLYALLPEERRSGRVIPLAAIVGALFTTWLSSGIFSRKREDTKKIIIVASKIHSHEILRDLDDIGVKYDYQGLVSPDVMGDDYINTLDAIDELVRVLSVDEVIFHSEDLSMKEIMKQMTRLGSKVRFKIAGDERLSIIGSNSKNKAGELYSVGVNYNLAEEYHQHVKRSFDVLSALLALILSPILLIYNGFKVRNYFKNVIQVLIGLKSMVGYGGSVHDRKNLPDINEGILLCSGALNDARNGNLIYARDYTVWQDAEIFIKNLNKLT